MTQQPINPDITSDDKLWALLSYLIPIIGVILLFIEDKKKRPFVRYNAVHAVSLLIVQVALSILLVGVCTFIFYLIYMIYLGIKSYQGEYMTVPVITDFVKKQGWVS